MGHEIGHVVLRHSAEQMEKRGKATGVVTVICVITSLCDGAIANVAINVAGAAWFAKHSRADEAEADSAGIVAVMATGISPRGIPTFFETLMQERQRAPTVLDDWFASHPLEEERVQRTQAIIDALPQQRLDALTADSPSFQALKARLAALPATVSATTCGAAKRPNARSRRGSTRRWWRCWCRAPPATSARVPTVARRCSASSASASCSPPDCPPCSCRW